MGESPGFVVIDYPGLFINAIVVSVEPATLQIWGRTMAKVAAGRKIQAEYFIAGFDGREKNSLVGLGARMWLYINIVAAE